MPERADVADRAVPARGDELIRYIASFFFTGQVVAVPGFEYDGLPLVCVFLIFFDFIITTTFR